jgi:hypothetical protein
VRPSTRSQNGRRSAGSFERFTISATSTTGLLPEPQALSRFRGIAIRYEKTVRSYRALARRRSVKVGSLAEKGVGLAYVMEPTVGEQLRKGRLRRVLDTYAATVPGFFLYFPRRAQSSPSLRLFVDAARKLAVSPTPRRAAP